MRLFGSDSQAAQRSARALMRRAALLFTLLLAQVVLAAEAQAMQIDFARRAALRAGRRNRRQIRRRCARGTSRRCDACCRRLITRRRRQRRRRAARPPTSSRPACNRCLKGSARGVRRSLRARGWIAGWIVYACFLLPVLLMLLNRAGMTFRNLPDADKQGLNAQKAISLMMAKPSVMTLCVRAPVICVSRE